MLKKYALKSLSAEYGKVLKKKKLREQKEFHSVLTGKQTRLLKKRFRKIHSVVTKVEKTAVKEFLNRKRKKIERNVTKNSLTVLELHKLRKRLKEYEYNRNSVGIKDAVTQSVKANTLPILLGSWHDCHVMIKHLEKVTRDRHEYPGEVILLNRLSNKVSDERDRLLVKIEKSLGSSEFCRK